MSDTIAWCESCDMPLVFTFVIRSKEFYCVGCGRTWGWWMEDRIDATPEREAQAEEIKAAFALVADPIIVTGSKRTDCQRCMSGQHGYHDEHATPEERAASEAAWGTLDSMRIVPAGASREASGSRYRAETERGDDAQETRHPETSGKVREVQALTVSRSVSAPIHTAGRYYACDKAAE